MIAAAKLQSVVMVLVWTWLLIIFIFMGPLNLLAHVPISDDEVDEEMNDTPQRHIELRDEDSEISVSPAD